MLSALIIYEFHVVSMLYMIVSMFVMVIVLNLQILASENIAAQHSCRTPPAAPVTWVIPKRAQDRYENLADKGLSLQLGGRETRQRLDHRRLGQAWTAGWWMFPPVFPADLLFTVIC